MKKLLFLINLLIWLTSQQAQGQNQGKVYLKVDSVFAQQIVLLSKERYHVEFGDYFKRSAKQLVTLVINPNSLSYNQDITLPVGVNSKMVTVMSGGVPLRLEKDYIFFLNSNRLRIINVDILKSDHLLRVIYERPPFTIAP